MPHWQFTKTVSSESVLSSTSSLSITVIWERFWVEITTASNGESGKTTFEPPPKTKKGNSVFLTFGYSVSAVAPPMAERNCSVV